MQIAALVVWLGLLFVLAKVVNYFAKRPLINPWIWLAASYGAAYVVGLFLGFARGTPDLAYKAGSLLPLTILAVGLGIWRAPKWRDAELKRREERAIQSEKYGS